MKADERQMMEAAAAVGAYLQVPDLPGNPKRVEYVLDKWCRRGWWEYGVSLRSGWLTPEGLAEVRELLSRETPVQAAPRKDGF